MLSKSSVRSVEHDLMSVARRTAHRKTPAPRQHENDEDEESGSHRHWTTPARDARARQRGCRLPPQCRARRIQQRAQRMHRLLVYMPVAG